MAIVDEIYGRWGNGTLRPASVPADPIWKIQPDAELKQYYSTKRILQKKPKPAT